MENKSSVPDTLPGAAPTKCCRCVSYAFPPDADILPPSDDRIFKVLLTHPNAKQVLIDVISSVIEQKVVDVQIRNNELPAMDVDEKNERFDVNCTIDTGDQVDVEMHCSEREEIGFKRTNFINKYIYYLTDLHSSQKSKKIIYRNLVKTYQITFCMYNIFPSSQDYVNRFSLRTIKGMQLSDQINIIIIELDKINDMLKKPVEKLTSFEKWSLFFRFAQEPVQRNLINDIIKDKEEINMAAGLLQEISQDEHERARLRSRKMWEMDQYSNYATTFERGEITERKKWQSVVADKDAALADKDAEIARLRAELEARKQ